MQRKADILMNETNKIYPRPENTIQFRFNKINGYCILRIKGLYLCSAVVKKFINHENKER